MRTLLIMAGIAFSAGAFAQSSSADLLIDKYKKQHPLDLNITAPSAGVRMISPLPKEPVYSHTLPSGAKVYALPQDNMPCVVPEVVSNMPVLPGIPVQPGQPGAIPNPGYGPVMVVKPPVDPKPVMKRSR